MKIKPYIHFVSLISTSRVLASIIIVIFMLTGGVASLSAQSEPSGAWLDQKNNWNKAGASIPKVLSPNGGSNLANCQHNVRKAALTEDALVEAAGWTLTGAAQIHGATTIITGMADADGMCRPLNYQVFVFTDGKFSGSFSPIPMDSRTDGSLIDFNLYREGYIDASFNRYTPEDALCCASRKSRIFYEVEMQNSNPVLMPKFPADTFPIPEAK